MSSKKILTEATEVELALPEDGFSSDFLNDLMCICEKQKKLEESYITLKNYENDVSLFFCFLFNDEVTDADQNNSISEIMDQVMLLFKDEIGLDAVSLNGKEQLKEAVKSVTKPYFERTK